MCKYALFWYPLYDYGVIKGLNQESRIKNQEFLFKPCKLYKKVCFS